MLIGAPNKISSFGVVNEAQHQILQSQDEDKKIHRSSVRDKQKLLERKREERIENLEERLKALASGRGGCLKFLQVISIVAAVVAAPISGGSSLGLGLGLSSMMTAATAIASAALGAIGALTEGLMMLKDAMKQKRILLNAAEEKMIMSIINETEKWVEDEKAALDHSNEQERESLEEYKSMLQDLERSFEAMIKA